MMTTIEKVVSAKANVSEAHVKVRTDYVRAGRSHKSFFETRVIEYQTSGALSWD
jgi:hypothetical protein